MTKIISDMTCFICGHAGRRVAEEELPKARGKRRKMPCENFVPLDETRHGNLLKLMVSAIRRKEENEGHLSRNTSISHDDLYVELQRRGTMISPKPPVQFCESCDQLARDVRRLYLELEVIQMKIVDKLRVARKLVVNRNFEAMEDDIITREQCGHANGGLRNIIARFQSLVKENDVNEERIPLVYLRNRLPKLAREQQMNLQGVMARSREEDSIIKQDIQDVDHDTDDASDCDDEIFYKNDVCNVKPETLKEIFRKGSNRKRGLLPRTTPIKRECLQGPNTERRSAALEASTLIKIATAPLPTRTPNPPKILTEAQLLARKIQHEANKVRAEKRILGLLKSRSRRSEGQHQEANCCESCGFEVRSMNKFEQHLRSHEDADKEKPFECPDCKERFVQRQYFEYHLTFHTNVRRVKCDICEELLFRVDLKEHHLAVHGKAYPCEQCTHCFGSVINFAHHCSTHLSADLTCAECTPPKVIKGNRAFIRHLGEVHDHKNLLISCEYPNCSQTYLFTERALHSNGHKKPFVCQYCGKGFVSNYERNKHILSIHEKNLNLVTQVCDLCGKKFSSKRHLEAHRISQHNFPTKFACEQCPGRRFTSKSYLDKHNQRFHKPESEWKFLCSMDGCQKRFFTKVELSLHLQHHGNEKPFMCDSCGHSSKTKRSLQKHAQVHTDVRKHACPECGKRFMVKVQLTDHIRLHTGERPFLCAVCGASYRQRRQLYNHKKKHKSRT